MSKQQFASGEVIDARPLPSSAKTQTLFQNEKVQILRWAVPAGREIPTHSSASDLLVQCLAGRVGFTALEKRHELEAGQLLYLPAHEPHSVEGLADSILLLTLLGCVQPAEDRVEEASEESFPASDAPSWTGG